MADVGDPFGLNHPGALVFVGVSTIATFATMAFFAKKNEESHEKLQAQIDAMNRRLTDHEHAEGHRIDRLETDLAAARPRAPRAGAQRPRLIIPVDEPPTMRSPAPLFS